MHFSPSDLSVLSRLLDAAMDLPATQLQAWLEALPQEQQRFTPQLREMLAQRPSGDGSLLATGPRFGGGVADVSVASPGERVGPHRLIREIGRGGMGSVWLAERADGAFRRQVALKLPRLAWGTGLAAIMAREREIGARLEHPNIARLYDAGVDEQGRPFLAMELVDGVAIDVWCRERGLNLRERLQLFLQVTAAVAYAHGRLVVHRDLKPSNVLVSPDGVVHLLDFGIARLLEDDALPGATGLTQQQARMLTPHYAAPEQIAGEPVTVQADVYSLGVLLYELLTGQLPVTPRRSTPAALQQAVLQGELPPASSRAASPAQAKALRGELDAILAMALQRDPAQRYANVQALAQDIERHLAGETVRARPDAAWRRLRKALRRHRVGVAAAAAVLAAVLGGSAVAVLQAQRALQAVERERAVTGFVAEVFRMPAPRAATPGELGAGPAEDFLQRSATLAEQRFAGQPALQADVYAMVGGAFADMGAYKLAAAYGERRLASLAQAGASSDARARAALQLATAQLGQRAFAAAEAQARQAIAQAGGDTLRAEAQVLHARVLLALGRRDEAARLLDGLAGALARGDGVPAWVQGLRAQLHIGDNRLDEAEPMMDAAIRAAHAAEGPDSPVAVELHLAMGNTLASTTFAERALQHNEAAVAILARRGGNHAVRAAFEAAAFAVYRYRAGLQGLPDEALAVVERSRRTLAAGGYVLPAEMSAQMDLMEGVIHAWTGAIDAALPLLERAEAVLYAAAASPAERRGIVVPYALALQDAGRHDQADRWLREAVALRAAMGLARHPHTALAHFAVAENLVMAGRAREALAYLDTAPAFDDVPGEGARSSDRYNQLLQTRRATAHLALGELRQARAMLPEALLANAGDRQMLLPLLGELHCAAGEPATGLRELSQSLDGLAAAHEYRHSPKTARIRALAGLCALRLADRPQALRLAHQAREAFSAQPAVSPFYKAPLAELERALGPKLPPF